MGVQFIMQGDPVPKGRPRFRICGGHVMTFTPPKTKDFEKSLAMAYAAENHIMFDKELPLDVYIEFGMPIPKGTSKKHAAMMAGGQEKHIKRPDIDNLVKSVLDALNGVAWEDDSQIISISAHKHYAETPFVAIGIKVLTGGDA